MNSAFLESSMERIARIIARRRGVNVALRGGMCCVDLEKLEVILPQVNEEQFKHLAPYLDGMLDHECGHVLWTELQPIKAAFGESTKKLKGKDRVRHGLMNAIEDTRIEKRMGEEYIGCQQNLAALNRHVAEWWDHEVFEKSDLLGRLAFGFSCQVTGLLPKEWFGRDPRIVELLDLLEPEIEEAKRVTSTAGSLAVADKILEKIKMQAEEKQEQEQPQPEEGGETGEEDQDDQDAGSGSNDGEENEGGAGSSRGEEDDDGEEEGTEDHLRDEGEGSADSPEGTEDGEASSGGDDQEAGEGDEEQDEDQPGSGAAKEFVAGMEADEFEKVPDVEDYVNRHMTKFPDWSTPDDPEHYVVFSEEFDKDHTYSVDERIFFGKQYGELLKRVSTYVGTMTQALVAALVAQTESRWVPADKRGRKLARRQVAEWVMGSDDDRIYKRLEHGESWDTAVTLLWDCSGSMGSSELAGNKAALARLAAIAFHEALLLGGIPHEVLGFNTGGGRSPELLRLSTRAARNGEDMRRYSRIDELDDRMVFVPFGQADGRAICAISGRACNRDGECVLWAAKRLAQRPERRRVLIVGSDGEPQGARYHATERRYLKRVVQDVMLAGLEVYGIGIMSEAVRDYYPNYVTINKPQDLPRVVMGQLLRLLTTKGTTNANRSRAVRASL